jgi:hypothetical protein
MSKLSGIRDVDRVILSELDDRELLKVCSIDRYTWNKVCDDAYLRRRLLAKYPQIEIYKRENESWKRFFLRAVRYIALMKEKYGYDYTFGDFVKQNKILKSSINKNKLSKDKVLITSAEEGELALVIWSLNSGANVHPGGEAALIFATRNGYLEIIRYLLEKGADIHIQDDLPLEEAIVAGNLEIIKYLVEHGANINLIDYYGDNIALIKAIRFGSLEIVKYLVEHIPNINLIFPINLAKREGRSEIVKYLKSKM